MVFDEIFLFVFLFSLLLSFSGAFGVCWVPTKRKQYRIIAENAGLKDGMVFCDLGSGTGNLLFFLCRNYGVKCIGVELSPLLFLYSKTKALFCKSVSINPHTKRSCGVGVKFGNLFNFNLANCDVVYFYLRPSLMPKIKAKLEKELKPGGVVVSYAFEIPGLIPYQIVKQEKLLPIFFYKL